MKTNPLIALLKRFLHWAGNLFRRAMPPAVVAPLTASPAAVKVHVAEPTPPPSAAPAPLKISGAATSRRRTKARKKPSSRALPDNFSDLLDSLDDTCDVLQMPQHGLTFVDHDTNVALRKLGMYVPARQHNTMLWELLREQPCTQIEGGTKLPSLMAVASPKTLFGESRSTKDDDDLKIGTLFFFGVRVRTSPARVQRAPPGTLAVYKFGVVRGLGEDKRHREEQLGIFGHIAVRDDHTVCLLNEYRPEHVAVTARHHGRKISSDYVRQQWKAPLLTDLVWSEKITDQRLREELLVSAFCSLHKIWTHRADQWSVGANRRGTRVTFGVPREMTAAYFQDRDKSVLARDGRAKRIVHFVEQHDRDVGGKTVKVTSHMRGLREFEWHDFHIVVTAPEFQRLPTVDVDLAAGYDTDPNFDSDRDVYLSKMATTLARAEDYGAESALAHWRSKHGRQAS